MVALVRARTARQHRWITAVALPVLLVSLLVTHFALMPAHGVSGHVSSTAGPQGAACSHGFDSPEPPQFSVPAPFAPQAQHADASQGGSSHGDHPCPACHPDPNHAWLAPIRSFLDQSQDAGLLLLMAMGGLVIGLFAWWPPVLASCRRWLSWSSSPWSGRDLLSFSCVSRT
jgi:hypothetical protein